MLNKKINLTTAEYKLMELFEQGLTYEQISKSHFISIRAIRRHVTNIRKKTGMEDFQIMALFVKDKSKFTNGVLLRKLTPESQNTIRQLIKEKVKHEDIARRMGVSEATVRRIKKQYSA